MMGKYEFTKLTVHDGGNLRTTTSTTKPDFCGKGLDRGMGDSPYVAPEVWGDDKFCASLFSEELSKADVFSLGMLMVHLVAKVNGVDFDQYKRYNVVKDEGKRNRILYEIIKMFEMEENSKAFIPILLTMIQVNPEERHLLSKVMQDFNIHLFGSKDSLKKGETLRFYGMTKEVAPTKHGYLKATVVRPHLRIHDISDLIAANIRNDEQIKEVELFFWNKHIRDKELITLSKGLNSIHSIESLKADFGNYPEITNYGLSYFLDT